jgi:hypothetical protein
VTESSAHKFPVMLRGESKFGACSGCLAVSHVSAHLPAIIKRVKVARARSLPSLMQRTTRIIVDRLLHADCGQISRRNFFLKQASERAENPTQWDGERKTRRNMLIRRLTQIDRCFYAPQLQRRCSALC